MEPDPGKLFLPPNKNTPETTTPSQSQTGNGPTVTYPVRQVTEPTKPKKRGLKALMIAIIGVVVMGAAGAFAYLGVIVPNQPENVLKTALTNLISAESTVAKGDVTLKVGDYSFNPNFGFEIAEDGGSALSFDISVPSLEIAAEIKQTSDDLYFKLSGIETLFDTWSSTIASYIADEAFISYLSERIILLDDEWLVIEGLVSSDNKQQVQTNEQAVIDAFKDREIFIVKNEENEDEVEGRATRHFKISVDKEELKAGLADIDSAQLNQEIKDSIASFVDEVQLNEFDVWIYKDTKEFARLGYQGDMGEMLDDATYNVELTFLSFNQTATIIPPLEAADARELWDTLWSTAEDREFIDPELFDLGPSWLDSIQSL